MPRVTELLVNGTTRHLDVDPDRSLLSVLREDLQMMGTKYGCGEGQCGACMVLVDGRPTNSCITAVGTLRNQAVTTIEGIAREGRLHPVQEAFLAEDALQCGYCTSGMIVSGVALLTSNPSPSRGQIVQGMNRNICRCCVYPRIIAALQRAATKKQEHTV